MGFVWTRSGRSVDEVDEGHGAKYLMPSGVRL